VILAWTLYSCPNPGRILGLSSGPGHDLDVHTGPYDDLVAHLVRSTPLNPGEAARVVAEVVGYFAEPVQDFVKRRHRELKHRGLRNEQIFEAIAGELATRRVRAPELSARQLRRMVYG
jgi:hypothetical protein